MDHAEHGTATGVHHRTALQACQIIANNAFHGYLATDRDGRDAVKAALDGLLTEDNYWFIVNRRDGDDDVEQSQGRDVYPIVPSFDEWAFPHHEFSTLGWDADAPTTLPPALPDSTFAVPTLPLSSSHRCVLSNQAYSTSKAHLVHSANSKWFRINSMRRYEDEQQSRRFIHNPRNIIPIRYDLHAILDAHAFVFVPKRGQFVAHVVTATTPGTRELAADWQNRPVQCNAFESVGKQYIFAKFAQAVFMLLKPFVAYSPTGRYVARLQATAGQEDKHEVRKEWLSGKSLEDLYSGGGSRKASASPSSSRKRSRSQASANNEKEWEWAWKTAHASVWADGSGDEWYAEDARGSLWLSDSDEQERGRPRKRCQRHGRSEHTVDTLPSLTDTSVVDVEEDHLRDSWSAAANSASHPPKPPDKPFHENGLTGEARGQEHSEIA